MIALKRILLPTDFSPNSDAAVAYAAELAKKFGAELHVLHVLEVRVDATPEFGLGFAVPARVQESRAAAEARLATIPPAASVAGAAVVRATAEGPPFVEIIRYARDHKIDLIVLSTHGRGGLAHVLMGSVAERVVRKAPCPVLTVRPAGHQFVMP